MNDMTLPINALARPGVGHNAMPILEALAETLAVDKARAVDLLEAAADARIATQTDAEKVADLVLQIRASEKAIDRIRDDFKRPLMGDARMIDAACGALIGPLARARETVKEMLDEWLLDQGPISPSIAQIGSRREIAFDIEDLDAALAWLLETKPGAIVQSVRTIVGSFLRQCGVDAIENGDVVIPGVSVSINKKASVR